MKKLLPGLLPLLISSCLSTPSLVQPVTPFDLEKYLGTWYEVARLDHTFERGLENVTATYTLDNKGSIIVQNRGYSPQKQKWKDIKGKAKPVAGNEGFLKVSFFGPFYSSYIIFHLDEDYSKALVCGSGTGYLWILSRTPEISEEELNFLIMKAREYGFNTDHLILVKH